MRRRGLVVGLGSIGRRHLANFRRLCPDAEIAVLRHRGDDGQAQRLGADHVLTRIEQAIGYAPDWSVIATPAAMHCETAIVLARCGSHLLVEKPIATSLSEARALVETCQQLDRVLMVGYNLRFEPALGAMHEAVTDGRIGEVLGIEASVGQYLPDWRPGQDYRQSVSARRELGGGALLELSHELDYVTWLAGGPMEVAWAQLRRQGDLEIEVEDWVDLQLRSDNGVAASIHMDFLSRVPHRRCRVTGTEASLTWDGIERTTDLMTPNGCQTIERTPREDRNGSYMAMSKHFLQCIETESPPLIDGECGMQVLNLVEAARLMDQPSRQAA